MKKILNYIDGDLQEALSKKIIKNESIIIPKNEIHINLSIVEDVTYSISFERT